MTIDVRRTAEALVDRLGDGLVRRVLRAFYAGRTTEAWARIAAAVGEHPPGDVGDPAFLEAVLDALEARVSPPDDDEEPDVTPTFIQRR